MLPAKGVVELLISAPMFNVVDDNEGVTDADIATAPSTYTVQLVDVTLTWIECQLLSIKRDPPLVEVPKPGQVTVSSPRLVRPILTN